MSDDTDENSSLGRVDEEKNPLGVRNETVLETLKRAVSDFRDWYRLRRGLKRADPKRTKSSLDWISYRVHHAHTLAEDEQTRKTLEQAMRDVENHADQLGMTPHFTSENLTDRRMRGLDNSREEDR